MAFDFAQLFANPEFKNFAGNALSDLGTGLSGGRNFQEGIQLATQATAKMAPYRAAEAEKRAQIAQEKAAINKTVEYLRSQPGGAQFADAIENGGVDGSAAFKAWFDASKAKEPDAPKFMEVGGKLVRIDGNNVTQAYDPFAGSGGVDPKEGFARESDISKQYLATEPVKTYQAVRNGYEKIRTSAKQDSGPGDISMIFAYMKMLDPTSVVREGEFATAENAGGVGQQISNLYNKLLTGERLGPDLKKQFLSAADQLYKDTASNLGDTNSMFSTRSSAWGVDPSRFVITPESYADDLDPLGLR